MVSIIVPVYNAVNVINRCLDSIINQTYKEIEIILVNDGSTDKSYDILKKYQDKDRRICLINQTNKGVAAARNTGLKQCKGDYFLFVDADDWIEPDTIACLLDKMSKDADIVYCSSDHTDVPKNVKRESKVKCEIWDHDRQLLEFMRHKRMTGMLWNKLIRRSLTEDIYFNEKTGYGEDAEFLWKVIKKSRKMVVTNEVLYHHVLEDTSISHCSFSEKKYSAIPMWESINADVEKKYPNLADLAKERLMCATVFSMYEAKKCGYKDKESISHMRRLIRNHLIIFLKSPNVSKKFKLYAIAVCLGY